MIGKESAPSPVSSGQIEEYLGARGEEIVKNLSDVIAGKYTADPERTHDKIVDFVDSVLKKEFTREYLENVRLFHVLVGSTTTGEPVHFDLPGGSIERFIRTEL